MAAEGVEDAPQLKVIRFELERGVRVASLGHKPPVEVLDEVEHLAHRRPADRLPVSVERRVAGGEH